MKILNIHLKFGGERLIVSFDKEICTPVSTEPLSTFMQLYPPSSELHCVQYGCRNCLVSLTHLVSRKQGSIHPCISFL